jgi:2',3'-cyclic-nucleotide 2'-phosphodiesterase (5'-nucleotidase family)
VRKHDLSNPVCGANGQTGQASGTMSRREFVAGSMAVAATAILPRSLAAAQDGTKTFTIPHTNDMHSAFIGMGPAADYTPFTLNDDQTRGGYARLAALIARQRAARQGQGPVLVLDAGDYRHRHRLRRCRSAPGSWIRQPAARW